MKKPLNQNQKSVKFNDYPIIQEIKDSLFKLGFKRPTDIQYKAIPHILRGEDVLAVAQTGTGKTAAFAIPVINRLQLNKQKARRKDGIKCVVMVPTHELALQVMEVFQKIAAGTKIRTRAIIGGVEQDPQIAQLEKGFDVLVATPGRVFDLIAQGHLKLNRVDTLILDEADHMLDAGFLKDIQDLIRHLPKKRQTLFFSATINEVIKKLAYSLVVNPIRIQVSPKDPVSKNVTHAVMFIGMDDKRFFLERLINEQGDAKILVFVRTKVRAERVAKAMARVNIESITIHSGKEQRERLEVMQDFKKGKTKVLIATDVSARGVDIPNVEYVVNYDLPDKSENYVHRVGRTGRGNNRGNAITFCAPQEKEMLDEIQGFLGKKIHEAKVDINDYKDTLDFTEDTDDNWKSVMDEINEFKEGKKKKRKKRK